MVARIVGAVAVFLGMLFALQAAQAESVRKVAFVVGNSSYAKGAPLKNPINDAKSVAAAMEGLGRGGNDGAGDGVRAAAGVSTQSRAYRETILIR